MSPTDRSETVAMIADDSRVMRELMAAMLAEHGIRRVIEAGDGAAALRVIREQGATIDLLFCDLAMPGIDGIDVIRRVALAHPHIAVVVFSGLDARLLRSVADMAEGMGLTVLGTLGKPFAADEVGALIERHHRARRERSRMAAACLTPEEIDLALAEDRLDVYFQPQTRMSDGLPIGVEALARLVDPHLGVLGPASFIAVAEASGRMPALSQRVMEKSIRQAGLWRREGLELQMALNLAPVALSRLDLPDILAEMGRRHGVDPARITLELTESQSALSPEMLHCASRFRLKGFELSVDDFGTGDSGLYRLRSLPFTELKIDRGFVAHAEHRDDLRSVLETSIDLGHRLKLKVIAEGVESWAQWHMLRGVNCDQAQGFLSAPAMPAECIPQTLAGWRGRLRAEGAQTAAPTH